ncbi:MULTISPECIES: ribosome silencing factor [Succinivibrio]|uniref:Ribosomal silencing factor RsfS n=1 Tax=Succinivibrio faecicola TaxID=2820300 RepID=A0ABS7DE33_9GAMM|nr:MULTISPECIES: ribosome silencing factor [Succinivibrio]MBW7569561.1 ribosome silencing factor [Succinivibrio faecicola]MDD6206366.1 ribosome silencing factor [Succinivibrio sp.]
MQTENHNTENLLERCLSILSDSKAHDIVNIDVSKASSLCDNAVICTGTSNRHVSAIAKRLEDKLYEYGYKHITLSGEQTGEWVIADLGEVMVHIMQDEVRRRYELDDLFNCMARGEA